VLESDDGKIIGIECKGSATVKADSFKGLKVLKERITILLVCSEPYHHAK